MIRQCELQGLVDLKPYFPLIGEMMMGAVSEVCTVGKGGVRTRMHLIALAERFPVVAVAVEGKPALCEPWSIFKLGYRYREAEWALADTADELRLRVLIERLHGKSEARLARLEAEVAKRRAARARREAAAIAAPTARRQAQARDRLLAAARRPRCVIRWASVLHDLALLLEEIPRPADRAFLSAILNSPQTSCTLSQGQLRWLAEILGRFPGAAPG